jgi:predicted nucleic-acid-binding protein
MKAVDTNVLVRLLVQDDDAQYRSALAFFDHLSTGSPARIDPVVLCELVWVLRSSYDYAREEVAEVVERILSTEQLEVDDAESAWLALEDFRTSKADFADCLIGQRARRAGCTATVTFDGRLKSLATFEILPHAEG